MLLMEQEKTKKENYFPTFLGQKNEILKWNMDFYDQRLNLW